MTLIYLLQSVSLSESIGKSEFGLSERFHGIGEAFFGSGGLIPCSQSGVVDCLRRYVEEPCYFHAVVDAEPDYCIDAQFGGEAAVRL